MSSATATASDTLRNMGNMRQKFFNTPTYVAPDRFAESPSATPTPSVSSHESEANAAKDFNADEYEPVEGQSAPPVAQGTTAAVNPDNKRKSNLLFAKHLPKLVNTCVELAGVLAYRWMCSPSELIDLNRQFDAKIMSGQALDEQEREQYAQIKTMLSEYTIREGKFHETMKVEDDFLKMQQEILMDIYNTMEEEKDPRMLVWMPTTFSALSGISTLLHHKVRYGKGF